jgi:hypothetical protein
MMMGATAGGRSDTAIPLLGYDNKRLELRCCIGERRDWHLLHVTNGTITLARLCNSGPSE